MTACFTSLVGHIASVGLAVVMFVGIALMVIVGGRKR